MHGGVGGAASRDVPLSRSILNRLNLDASCSSRSASEASASIVLRPGDEGHHNRVGGRSQERETAHRRGSSGASERSRATSSTLVILVRFGITFPDAAFGDGTLLRIVTGAQKIGRHGRSGSRGAVGGVRDARGAVIYPGPDHRRVGRIIPDVSPPKRPNAARALVTFY